MDKETPKWAADERRARRAEPGPKSFVIVGHGGDGHEAKTKGTRLRKILKKRKAPKPDKSRITKKEASDVARELNAVDGRVLWTWDRENLYLYYHELT